MGVGVREWVQPGVAEAFFCRGSFPAHTDTITVRMCGKKSRRVYISSRSNPDPLLNSSSPRWGWPSYSFGFGKTTRYFKLKIPSDSGIVLFLFFSSVTTELLDLNDIDSLWLWM